MIELINRQFIVPASVDSAWEHFAMVEQWPSWATHIKRLELTTDQALGVDSQGEIFLRNGIKSTFKMTEFNPKQNWKWVGPFLWMNIIYDHRFREINANVCEMTFHVAAEGFLVGFFGKAFAQIYNRNLDTAIPNLIAELQAIQ